MKKIVNNIDDKIQVSVTVVLFFFLFTTSLTYIYCLLVSDEGKLKEVNNLVVNLDMSIDTVLPIKNNEEMISLNTTDENRNTLLSVSLKNGCLNSNKEVVCKIYKISIKNLSDVITQVLDGSISFYADKNLQTNIKTKTSNLKWRLIESYDEKELLKSNLGTNEDNGANFNKNFFIKDEHIKSHDEANYYLLVWLDSEIKEKDSINNYFVEVQFDSSNGTNITSIFES